MSFWALPAASSSHSVHATQVTSRSRVRISAGLWLVVLGIPSLRHSRLQLHPGISVAVVECGRLSQGHHLARARRERTFVVMPRIRGHWPWLPRQHHEMTKGRRLSFTTTSARPHVRRTNKEEPRCRVLQDIGKIRRRSIRDTRFLELAGLQQVHRMGPKDFGRTRCQVAVSPALLRLSHRVRRGTGCSGPTFQVAKQRAPDPVGAGCGDRGASRKQRRILRRHLPTPEPASGTSVLPR